MYPYPNCKFCGGEGCLACEGEHKKDSSLENNLLFSARYDNERDMELLKNAIGKDALDKAFSPDGEGMAEIKLNLLLARLIQATTGEKE
jgi:hypothetical protein